MNIEEKLYTSTEVAEVLGVSLRSVYRYLEQEKLEAEIKTATGRLRFTKKNITDFLYPSGGTHSQVSLKPDTGYSAVSQREVVGIEDTDHSVDTSSGDKIAGIGTVAETPEKSDVSVEVPRPSEITEETPVAKPEPEQEIDWLAKFKAAAQEIQAEPAPAPDTSADSEKKDSISFLTSSAEEEKTPEISFRYYKSMLGGLKEIAQNIDKVGRKSGVDYAFTLYAGLSLDKPLKKPFSVLHAYVKPSTGPLFKRMLQLEETDANNGQLCLMFTESTGIFANKVEKHGLFVVSNEQIEDDFKLLGLEDELAS